MSEIWKEIKGYEGLYQVSNTGKVKSCERLLRNNKHVESYRICEERIMKGCENNRGYLFVDLYKGKRQKKRFYIHVLVAKTFVDNPDNFPEVNHEDGNKLNNNDCNLKWTTRSGNQKHAVALGLIKPEIARAAKLK